MLSFSTEEILLNYKDNKNLSTSLQLKNHSQSTIYYKVLCFWYSLKLIGPNSI